VQLPIDRFSGRQPAVSLGSVGLVTLLTQACWEAGTGLGRCGAETGAETEAAVIAAVACPELSSEDVAEIVARSATVTISVELIKRSTEAPKPSGCDGVPAVDPLPSCDGPA
jgi:hypothetical protein